MVKVFLCYRTTFILWGKETSQPLKPLKQPERRNLLSRSRKELNESGVSVWGRKVNEPSAVQLLKDEKRKAPRSVRLHLSLSPLLHLHGTINTAIQTLQN